MTDRTLAGFDVSTFTHDARTHDVYRAASVRAGRDRDPRASWHLSRNDRVRRATHRRELHGLAAVPARTSRSADHRAENLQDVVHVCASREFAILADRTNPAEHNEWDGATLADDYLRTLWRLLALVCVPGTIHYEIVPSFIREELLSDPTTLDARAPAEMRAALRLTCAERLDSWIGFVACC